MIYVRFADLGWPVASPVISWVTDHWANHCDLILNDGRMISAMPLSGVTEGSPAAVKARRVELVPVDTAGADGARIASYAREQLGKPYDYLGVFAFPFRPKWNDPKRWFCSELTAAALAVGGAISIPDHVHRISPGDLYRVLEKAGSL